MGNSKTKVINDPPPKYSPVSARPVKRFFVEMLTRDISIENAILDLLDNCIDGVLRNNKNTGKKRPYSGYWAHITITPKSFEIKDNCNGIPWSEHDRAFRMGSLSDSYNKKKPTVGTYGIGMKRAIFKIGTNAIISTQNKTDRYEVLISPEWIADQEQWDLPVEEATKSNEPDGTLIYIDGINNEIKERFSSSKFIEELIKTIQHLYSVILQKGFEVKVNGIEAIPKPINFKFTADETLKKIIRPYIFTTELNGVEIFLAVGLRDSIPNAEDLLSEQESNHYKSDTAGWTVICNDRVVLYCDKTEITGWGTANVPKYHTQFIAITGIVEFKGNPRLLPTTTTKRGIDTNVLLYSKVLNKMREGTKIFTDFTNSWKTREDEVKKLISSTPSKDFSEIKKRMMADINEPIFNKTRTGLMGKQVKPKLPQPRTKSKDARISFFKETIKINRLAEHFGLDTGLLGERKVYNLVGSKSFDYTFDQLKKKD